jgi:hypothetical protein
LVLVFQILEVDDEWNILKSTLHWRRVQKISIILTNLEEYFVISNFYETKIPGIFENLEKIKFEKKWNLQSPWGLEHLILPNVGASFKKHFKK